VSDLLECGEEQVYVLNLFELTDEKIDIFQELRWCMIMQYVHVYSLVAAGEECSSIILGFDTSPNTCDNHSSGIDGL